jgi:predicted N-acetyltransferase YhbS
MGEGLAPPAGARVRAATAADLPAIVDLWAAAFDEARREEMRAYTFDDPSHQLHQSRLAEVDGGVASYLRVASRTLRYGPALLRMGGIGSVGTRPDYRARGLSTALLADSIAYMRAQGYQLSMLFTGIHGFYARLGWVPFPRTDWRVPLPASLGRGAASPGEPAVTVRPYERDRDLPGVRQVHAAYNAGRTATALREEWYWAMADAWGAGITPTLVAEQRDRVVAFATLSLPGGSCRVDEACCLPGHERAFVPLARAILARARQAGAPEVAASLGDTHGLLAALRLAAGTVAWATVRQNTMLLLLDLDALLRAALPALQERLERHPYPGDLQAAFGLEVAGQRAGLTVAGGTVGLGAAPAAPILALEQGLFWRLFLGATGASSLVEELATLGCPRLTAMDWTVLSTLFPYQDPLYWRADGF